MKRFLIVGSAVLLAACDTSQAGDENARPRTSHQYIVAFDLSASISEDVLAEHRIFVDKLVKSLSYGDQLVLLQVHLSGPLNRVKRWSDSVSVFPGEPTATDRRNLAAFHTNAQEVADMYIKRDSARIATTDILSTIAIAAEYSRSARGRRPVLVLLSDMMHSTPQLDMERGQVPGEQWIAARKASLQIPRLNGTCVVAVGVDASSSLGARVRDFWQDYFTAAGAVLSESNYRPLVPDVSTLDC